METQQHARLGDLVKPGCRVAIADGVGTPKSAVAELCDVARTVGDVKVVLGWWPVAVDDFRPDAFADARTLMAGYGLRRLVDQGAVHYVSCRLQTACVLLRGVLRPDVLVASVARTPRGWTFTSEVSWMRAAVNAGAIVAAVESPGHPVCDGGPAIPDDQLRFIGVDESPPSNSTWADPGDVQRAIGAHVEPFIVEGARLQFGPGPLSTGILESLHVPVRVDTGMITDAVLTLRDRGLLLDLPIGPYMAGSTALYEWANGKEIMFGLEVTHDQHRLGTGSPLITINTALEVDFDGQVNVESVGGSAIAGIGGQPDYAFAGSSAVSGGLSILAVPTRSGTNPTLVERLSAPVSTPSHDFDVVVTEQGSVDLRGRDRRERRDAIASLWA
jgi:hypothetical protein